MADKYYLRIRGKVLGPFEMKQLQSLRSRGKLGRSNDISMDRRDWVPASEVPELFPEESQATTLGESHETESSSAEPAEAESSPESQHQWHYTLDGQNDGPVPTMVLLQMISTGQLKPTDDVWREGMANWEPANSIPELQGAIGETVPVRETLNSGSRSSSGFWGKFLVTTLILLVIGGGGFGAYSYFGTNSIRSVKQGDSIEEDTTAVDLNGYIVDITRGDADVAIADAVGLVVSAFASIKHDGSKVSEYSVKEQMIPNSLYHKKTTFERVGDKATLVTKYEQIPISLDKIELKGVFVQMPKGKYQEIPSGVYAWNPKTSSGTEATWTRYLTLGSTGTCFMISKDGYALTNRHVIEEAHKYQLARNLIKEVRERFKYQELIPTVHVFVNGKLEVAKIVHVSDQFDLCILKINRAQQAMFRLSNGRALPRGEDVFAVGFPGAARKALTELEGSLKQARLESAKQIEHKFRKEDLKYAQTSGSIGSSTSREGTGDVLLHNADINGGNSGGPLIDVKGIVYGINTWSITQASGESGTFYAQRMKQFRDEIDEHVKTVKWIR